MTDGCEGSCVAQLQMLTCRSVICMAAQTALAETLARTGEHAGELHCRAISRQLKPTPLSAAARQGIRRASVHAGRSTAQVAQLLKPVSSAASERLTCSGTARASSLRPEPSDANTSRAALGTPSSSRAEPCNRTPEVPACHSCHQEIQLIAGGAKAYSSTCTCRSKLRQQTSANL